MKKIYTTFLTLFLAIGVWAQSGTCGDNLTWTLEESTGTLTISGTGAMWNWGFDEYYGELLPPWIDVMYQIGKIEIHEGVTSIGRNAFDVSKGLLVSIPQSVSVIKNNAFSAEWSVTAMDRALRITIQNSTPPTVEGNIFDTDWMSNTILKVPANSVDAYSAADGWKNFTYISEAGGPDGTCGDNTTWMLNVETETLTFGGSGSIKSYIFGEVPPWSSFSKYIKTVVVGEEISEIGYHALAYCGYATTVFFNAKNCTSMGDTTFPAFGLFGNFTTLHIGDQVTNIPAYAFLGCSKLTTVTIPASVVNIGERAFRDCTALKTALFSDGLLDIGKFAFHNCISLDSVVIPNTVKEIRESAFARCINLTEIVLPGSLEEVKRLIFANCTSLVSVNISHGVKVIGEEVFTQCSNLKTIKIPASVISIGVSTFSGCNSLDTVKIGWIKPISVVANVFSGLTTANIKLVVPEGTTDAYMNAPVWQDFAILENVEVATETKDTEATILWESVYEATGYTLTIYGDELRNNVLFTFKFDNEGRIKDESGDKSLKAANQGTYSYTVTGLTEGVTYYYSLSIIGDEAEVLRELTGEFATTTGGQSSVITDNADMQISAYLNPVTNILYIRGVTDDCTIAIYDFSGRQIIETNSTDLDMNTLPQGTYVLKAGTYTRKLIKK